MQAILKRITGTVLIITAMILVMGTAGGIETAEDLDFETVLTLFIFFVSGLGCAGMGMSLLVEDK
jgi:hypothetical protein